MQPQLNTSGGAASFPKVLLLLSLKHEGPDPSEKIKYRYPIKYRYIPIKYRYISNVTFISKVIEEFAACYMLHYMYVTCYITFAACYMLHVTLLLRYM